MSEHPAVATFREYLRIPSVHPDPDYAPCVEFWRKQASLIGLPIAVHGTESKPIVVMTWKGTSPELPSIALNAHMDVVPVYPEKWTHPPFSGHKTADGKIYGRGAQDMKNLAIQYLAAVQQLKSEGFQPKRTIHLLNVPDEEIGSAEGMEKFVKTSEFKNLNIGFVLDEGIVSETENFIVFNDERSKWVVNFICNGPTGHGSLLFDNTAGEKMRVVLDEVFNRRAVEVKKLRSMSDEPFALGKVTSFNLTMVEGGVQDNVVPDRITLVFDIRLGVNEDHDLFLDWIKGVCRKAGNGTEFSFTLKDSKVPPTPVDDSNPFWTAFKGVMDKLNNPFVVAAIPGATDARFFRKLGIPAYGVTLIRKFHMLLHDHDEHILETDYLEGIAIYVDLIRALTEEAF